MDERNEHGQVDTNLGISRRAVLRRGAVVGGSLVWAAPAVQSISRTAFAQTVGTPSGADHRCTGFAYNVLLQTAGLVQATVGPLNASPQNQDFPESCIADLTANVGGGAPEVVVGIACVENDFNATCCTRSTLTRVAVDLSSLGSLLDGLGELANIQLNADVLSAEACAACGAAPTASASLTNASITVLGATTNLAAAPAPNTNVAGLSASIALVGSVDVSLVLNEQTAIPGGIAVNVVHLNVDVKDLLGAVSQSVDLVLGHAEADVHDCP